MASTELYSSIAKPKKKYTFGQKLGDYGRLMADTALSTFGASDVISDDAYKGEWAENFSGILSPIASTVGQVGLAAATGGTGNAALSAAKAVGPSTFSKGGLRTFEGNTHEQGGIQLGQDEVEMGETMMPIDVQSDFIFSDRITVPGSKQSFADKSKRISKKYSLRPNDPYGKKSEELELKNLAELQEAVKIIDVPDGMFADGGIHIKKSNRGKFTKSAKSAGMGVQEFARHVLANKEDYSSTQVKRANFAKNAASWKHAMGGKRYFDGGFKPYLEDEGYVDDIPFDTASIVNSLKPDYNFMQDIQGSIGNGPVQVYSQNPAKPIINNTAINRRTIPGITPSLLTPKGYSPTPVSPMKSGNPLPKENIPYQSNFTLPALGYAAQALTNIPALFTKPDTINSSRVKFDDINLAEQRNEARRARNLGLATARGIGATDAGQMMNYLSGTTAALNSVYGNQFNQSLLQEQQANAEMNMREQLANSEIERYDEQINTQERDAVRNLKMQSLMNMGTSAAMAGKGYMDMQQGDAQINAYGEVNPYFAANNKGIYRKPGSKFSGGGKRTKDPLAGVTISKGNSNPETGLTTPYDPTTHPLYPNYPDKLYSASVTPTVISAKNTPVGYRGDAVSRMEDARRLPGYGYPINEEGLMKSTPEKWGVYPEKVRASMMRASVSDRADYEGLREFAASAPLMAGPTASAKAAKWLKPTAAVAGIGGGTALQYSDSEAAQNLGEYMQLIGGVEALPYLGKGLALLPYLAKGAVKLLKKVPPAVTKGIKTSAKFVKDNPRTLYAPALGGKYLYDRYEEKSTENKAQVKDMYNEIPQEDVNLILDNIRRRRR